ncbi:MAG: ribonuclease E/G, partial [Lachnospiraceae bacterium]|nr:ribonuclease E/G [Lachnospiraceae bacterium]
TLYSVLYTPPADYLLALRDTYALSFRRIVTDIPEVYEQLTSYFTDVGDTESLQKLSFFDNGKKSMSLLNFYRLGERIKEALSERVWLKSGGYLVIEPTESLTAIDVNTGKYTGKSDAEDTYWKINTEAAQMIALQLRLRNVSGMILVDFINMKERERKEQLLELLRSYTADDPVHTSVIDMTPLGLVEITRKKIRKSLKEQYHETAFHE